MVLFSTVLITHGHVSSESITIYLKSFKKEFIAMIRYYNYCHNSVLVLDSMLITYCVYL